MSEIAVRTLGDLVSRPEGHWTLTDGILAVAGIAPGSPADEAVRSVLRDLATSARQRIDRAQHARFVAGGLSAALFDHGGLVVDSDDQTPQTRLIDRALETRKTAQSLMAPVYIECARIAGYHVEGTGIPGPLVLRIRRGASLCYVDTVGGFPLLSTDDLQRRVHQMSGGRLSFRESGLSGITASQVLARLIRDLKAVYWARGDQAQALAAIDMMLAIRPDDPREMRDRGRALFLLGRYDEAIAQLESYLSIDPRGEDAEAVRLLLLQARTGHNPKPC